MVQTSLSQIVCALSDALDLVGVDDVAHGKRVGVMASQCGAACGMSTAECDFLLDLGLLHDIGVSSTQVHQHLLQEFDWENSQEHAIKGYEVLKDFVPLSRMAVPIRYHHTRWDELEPLIGQALTKQEALESNLIFLVDRVDTFAAPYYGQGNLFEHVDAIRQRIKSVSGSYFSPEMVSAFMAASDTEAFWLALEPRVLTQRLAEHAAVVDSHPLSEEDLLKLARIFAGIVDAKSRFTREHSEGVTRLATFIGRTLGLSAGACARLEIAALLHDLGKLRIPDEILEKPGPLDEHERHVINTHSFETYQILHKIPGFEDIAQVAAYHHEVPDGSGYPFHLRGDALSTEARILRVADIVQALGQNRPYRKGMSQPEIESILMRLVEQKKIDLHIVRAVTENFATALRLCNSAAN